MDNIDKINTINLQDAEDNKIEDVVQNIQQDFQIIGSSEVFGGANTPPNEEYKDIKSSIKINNIKEEGDSCRLSQGVLSSSLPNVALVVQEVEPHINKNDPSLSMPLYSIPENNKIVNINEKPDIINVDMMDTNSLILDKEVLPNINNKNDKNDKNDKNIKEYNDKFKYNYDISSELYIREDTPPVHVSQIKFKNKKKNNNLDTILNIKDISNKKNIKEMNNIENIEDIEDIEDIEYIENMPELNSRYSKIYKSNKSKNNFNTIRHLTDDLVFNAYDMFNDNDSISYTEDLILNETDQNNINIINDYLKNKTYNNINCCFYTCRKNKSFITKIKPVIILLNLTPIQKRFIIDRYFNLIREYEYRVKLFNLLYNILNGIIIVDCILLTSILSLRNTDNKEDNIITHWIAWGLSLILGLLNGFISFYKIDKKYFHLNTILEDLKCEGWKFVQLTDKYKINHATHHGGFIKFCNEIERIKHNGVELEFSFDKKTFEENFINNKKNKKKNNSKKLNNNINEELSN